MASDVGGIPEVLEGGEAGVLVPAHLPEQLVAALMELIDNSDPRDLLPVRISLSCLRAATETTAA